MKFSDIRFVLLCVSAFLVLVSSFSVPDSSKSDGSFALFDRFRSWCPADRSCIRAFDASLIQDDSEEEEDAIWVAVFRSSNNKPSVFVKDEFLNAMRIATGAASPNISATTVEDGSGMIETNSLPFEEVPVAVARLRPSPDFSDSWIMDSMRCLLQKEDTDSACDGGSEHTEALGVGIDALLLHHLNGKKRFESCIRTKATLVSGPILEERGFSEVQSLSKDMATHVSSIDACIEGYSKRTIMQGAKNPGARDRALQIINLLGRLDVDDEKQKALQEQESGNDDDYDPWSGIKQFI